MLYHRDVNLPPQLKKLKKQIIPDLAYSYHAQNQAYNKGIILPDKLEYSGHNIIEAEIIDSIVYKLVVRVEYEHNSDYDICLVIINNNGILIKTLWLNNKTDTHKTLDKSNYL